MLTLRKASVLLRRLIALRCLLCAIHRLLSPGL